MFSFRYSILVFTVFALLMTGCVPPQDPSANQPPSNVANGNTNTAPAANTQPVDQTARNAALPVTMPLLDAMFQDEAFAEEAKTSVRLTDEELAKIRDAARNAVLQLDSEVADDERSTRASVEKTQKAIEAIIGPQRTAEFFNLIRTRWGGGGELTTGRPNSIPTDTRIVINAPAFRMDLFNNGQLVKTYKIGIGYPEFPLPVGLRKAEEIIFNPTWTPPDEPWVKGKVQPGKKVEAGSKLNPLGPIKIPIGLPSLIHGGKDPSRLGTFASHGCVGLTSPMVQEFAVDLASLTGSTLTAEDVKNYAKQKTETKEVDLAQPVPVELRYETIVVQDGKVYIYRDVYEKGTNTEENLRKVLEVYGVTLESLSEQERSQLMDAIEQMAVDAQGDAVTGNGNVNSNSNSANSNSGKVTRNIKGKKEIAVDVAALRGKGYPAPASMPSDTKKGQG